MSKVKCPICGEFFNRNQEESYYFNSRYYHPSCCSNDFVYTEKIFILVKELWGTCARNKIQKQILQFTKQLNCDVQSIYNDLIYFFQVKKSDTTTYRNTIGIVPFIHSEAQKYYFNLQHKEDNKTNIAQQLQCIQQTERTVYVTKKPQQRKQFELEVEKE